MVHYLNEEKERIIVKNVAESTLNLQNFILEVLRVMSKFCPIKLTRDDLMIYLIYKEYIGLDLTPSLKVQIGTNNIGQYYGTYKLKDGTEVQTIFFPYESKKEFLLKEYLEIENFFNKISLRSNYLSISEVNELDEMIKNRTSAKEIVLKFKRTLVSLRRSYKKYINERN